MQHEHPDPLVSEKKTVDADAARAMLRHGLITQKELSGMCVYV
jgi:hypothetical protein